MTKCKQCGCDVKPGFGVRTMVFGGYFWWCTVECHQLWKVSNNQAGNEDEE